MAKLEARPKLNMEVRLILSLDEALALDGLACYGDDAFLKVFKEKLGTHYIRDHENGLRSFLKTVRTELGFIRDFSRDIQDICSGQKIAVHRDTAKACDCKAPPCEPECKGVGSAEGPWCDKCADQLG